MKQYLKHSVLALSILCFPVFVIAQSSYAENMKTVRGFTLGETCEAVRARLMQEFKTPGSDFFGRSLDGTGTCAPDGAAPIGLTVYFTAIGVPHSSMMMFGFDEGGRLIHMRLSLGWESPDTAPLIKLAYEQAVERYARPYFGIDLGYPDRGGANGPFVETYWATANVAPASTRIQPAQSLNCLLGRPVPPGMVCGAGLPQRLGVERDAARSSAKGVFVKMLLLPFEESTSGRARRMILEVTDVEGNAAANAAYQETLKRQAEREAKIRAEREKSRLPSF